MVGRSLVRIGTAVAGIAGGLLAPSLATAAEGFSLDAVFVSRFDLDTPELQMRADRLEAAIRETLSEVQLVLTVDDARPFEDYSAAVYLQACPTGQRIGCAFVLGERADADWVITGSVRWGEADEVTDDILAEDTELLADRPMAVSVAFVDVTEGQVILTYDAELREGEEALFAAAVRDVFDRLLAGEGRAVDRRRPERDPEAERAARRSRIEVIAASLADEAKQVGSMARGGEGTVERVAITDADLQRLSARDDIKPWERVGLDPETYKAFVNSGRSLEDWRWRAAGRRGQVLVRLLAGGGLSATDVLYEGRIARDGTPLEVVQRDVWQDIGSEVTGGAGLELGIGLAPAFDVAVGLRSRSSTFAWRLHAETVGEARQPRGEPQALPLQTAQLDARLSWVPLLQSAIRPTVDFGASWWFGPGLADVVDPSSVADYPVLPAASVGALQLGLGAELDVGKRVALLARTTFAAPLTPLVDRLQEGANVLEYPVEPRGGYAATAVVEVGVLLRLGGQSPSGSGRR